METEDIIEALSNDEFSSDSIIERMRNSLKNPASKIEGSFAMDSIFAVSQELSRVMYERVINFIDLTMLDTAPYEYLDRKGQDYGLERNPATPAVGMYSLADHPERSFRKERSFYRKITHSQRIMKRSSHRQELYPFHVHAVKQVHRAIFLPEQ